MSGNQAEQLEGFQTDVQDGAEPLSAPDDFNQAIKYSIKVQRLSLWTISTFKGATYLCHPNEGQLWDSLLLIPLLVAEMMT